MALVDWIGAAAGLLTTIAFIPQVVKTWRTRSAEDISLFMFILFSTGVLCWLIYGVALKSWPMIVANSVTLVLALSILYLKLRYMWEQRQRLLAAEERGL